MLSKTDFLLYLEAPMHLWARAHDRLEVKTHSLYEQYLSQQGQQVEALAREFLKIEVLPRYKNAQLIWQPSYDDGQFEIRADALILDSHADAYDLYEIKSSTSIHSKHKYDLTFQVLLLENLLTLKDVHILHIDKTYQHGEKLDLERFFTVDLLTEEIEALREVVIKAREAAWRVTQLAATEPDFACTKPHSCPCPSLCHPQLPKKPIYDIPYIGKKAVTLREMGVTAIKDIPPSFNLSIKQHKHLQAVKSGHPIIDFPAIQQSLSTLQYPLYFLDYETFNPAIPLFLGYRPYEHIVFQYSLFVIDHCNAEAQHFDCLLTDQEDPAQRIVLHLLHHIGPKGSIIVWNQSFEEHRNRDLAAHCPQYAEALMGINERLYDLMRVFKDGHFVHPDFHGSASLKAVLPVLCPDLRYEDLAIGNGEEAMLTWYRLQIGEIPSENQAEIENAMKAYCRLDTYGMVSILEKLRDILRHSHEP